MDANLQKAFREVDLENYEQPNLGSFSFRNEMDLVRELYDFLALLIGPGSSVLPNQIKKDVENFVRQFVEHMRDIKAFDPKGRDLERPTQLRQELVDKTQSLWNAVFNHLSSAYFFVYVRKSRIEEFEDDLEKINEKSSRLIAHLREKEAEIQGLVEQSKHEINKTREAHAEVGPQIDELINNTNRRLNKIEEEARIFTAKEVVTKYGKIFQDQAEQNHKPKIRWWWFLLLLSIAIECFAAYTLGRQYLMDIARPDLTATQSLSIGFAKIFILSTIGVFVVQCIKNLNAHNHLFALNIYRANALASFQAFLNATENEEVKDILLIQIAKAIYDPNVSGFLSKDDSSHQLNFAEMIKGIPSSR